MTIVALIVAAGRGSRARSPGEDVPKQYRSLAGIPVLRRSIAAFSQCPGIAQVQVVIHGDDEGDYRMATAGLDDRLRPPVYGGATRQASVRNGLEALDRMQPRHVLIHDAARPLVDRGTIGRVVDALKTHAGAIAALPVADTLRREKAARLAGPTLDRHGLWRAQTPQGFHFDAILAAHRKAAVAGRSDFTDDAAIAEWAGIDVGLVTGSERNLKLTTTEDFAIATELLRGAAGSLEPRTGTGLDVHRFCPGDHVWLAGVRIPHSHGLEGHSDADVALHALTDAILGALGDGDIGQHFPPSDPQWKGAPSRHFLADAARRLADRGGRIANVDVTLLCEAPRIGPYRDDMQRTIAGILGIEPNRVGVKATTTEGLGFTGRGEGIAAMASATLLLPP